MLFAATLLQPRCLFVLRERKRERERERETIVDFERKCNCLFSLLQLSVSRGGKDNCIFLPREAEKINAK